MVVLYLYCTIIAGYSDADDRKQQANYINADFMLPQSRHAQLYGYC